MGRLIITNTRTTGSTSWTYIPLNFYCRTVRITGTGANTLCAQHRVEVEQDLEQEVVFQKELIVPVFQVQTLKQHLVTNMYVKLQKKSNLHYTRDISPKRVTSGWARRNVTAVASRWRHTAEMTGPGIEPLTSHTNSDVLNN